MITLYGFKSIFPEGIGETKDLRVQWALEELGLPYAVHGLDHSAGDLDAPDYTRMSPFHQVPVIDDDGFVVAESVAILLYLAEKAGRLSKDDLQERTRITQWCLAAVSSVAPPLTGLDMVGIFGDGDAQRGAIKDGITDVARRFLGHLEQHLDGREWIASGDFTVADVLMANILRGERKSGLLDAFPRTKAYAARAHARPAWERTLALTAERMNVSIDSIR